jgi:8-hydroxy-5-deazaflavin:NADPH oxidoreductase
MKIAVFGTGSVGQTLATRLAGLGHAVVLGTRNVENSLARVEKDFYGTPTVGEFLAANPQILLKTFAIAAENAEIIVNATKGTGSNEAFELAGVSIKNQIVIDISNPLDFSAGGLPTMIVGLSNTNSLGEALQNQFPNLKIVKTLNTMWSGLMVQPSMVGGGDHVNFICGNDEVAKSTVKTILQSFGWPLENMLDLGDITAARGTEAILPLWVRIWSVTQNGVFNFKLVK